MRIRHHTSCLMVRFLCAWIFVKKLYVEIIKLLNRLRKDAKFSYADATRGRWAQHRTHVHLVFFQIKTTSVFLNRVESYGFCESTLLSTIWAIFCCYFLKFNRRRFWWIDLTRVSFFFIIINLSSFDKTDRNVSRSGQKLRYPNAFFSCSGLACVGTSFILFRGVF